jgi:hypothetical protein
MRRQVVDILHNFDLTSHSSSNDVAKESLTIQDICYEFLRAFIRYRSTLTVDEKELFDRSWSFLSHYNTDDDMPDITLDLNNEIDPRYLKFFEVAYSEIRSVYEDSNRTLGNPTNYYSSSSSYRLS